MTRSINGFRLSWVNQWQRVLAEHETVPGCAYQFLISADWKIERCETVPHDDADRDATEGSSRFEKQARTRTSGDNSHAAAAALQHRDMRAEI